MRTSVPLFLSSAKTSGSSSEGSFTQQLTPPLQIPEAAKNVTVHVDSATVPFSFPNLTSETARVQVKVPLTTNPSTQSGTTTLTLPTGVYDLTEIAEQINRKVNEYLHTNGYPVLVGDWTYFNFNTNDTATKADVPNFCTLLPNFHTNRVELLLNHSHSAIDFHDTVTTLDSLLGFTSLCERTVSAQVEVQAAGYQLTAAFRTVEYGAPSATWVNVTFTVPQGTYTLEEFVTEVNSQFVTAVQARPYETYDTPRVAAATATGPLIQSVTLEASEEVPGSYRADPAYATFNGQTAGSAIVAHRFPDGSLDATEPEIEALEGVFGNLGYAWQPNVHTRATMWAGAQTTPFTAELAATIDKVTEVGISAPGLSHGSYSSSGDSTGATLARFQVTGLPGTNMVYRPPTPLKLDASHLINTSVPSVTIALVDQHGTRLSSLQGEKFSVVLCIEWEV